MRKPIKESCELIRAKRMIKLLGDLLEEAFVAERAEFRKGIAYGIVIGGIIVGLTILI